MSVRELLQLAPGAIVELDRLAGEPLDVLVNGVRIARGEVVVVNEKFGIRLTDVVSATRADGTSSVSGLAQPASPLSAGSLTQLTLSLLAIVALIVAVSWALKRLKMAGGARSGRDRGDR